MNQRGGSWKGTRLTRRAEDARADWKAFDAAEPVFGYHWIVLAPNTLTPIALLSFYRSDANAPFKHYAYLQASASHELRVAVMKLAFEVFCAHQRCPEVVMMQIPTRCSEDLDASKEAGYVYVLDGVVESAKGNCSNYALYVQVALPSREGARCELAAHRPALPFHSAKHLERV